MRIAWRNPFRRARTPAPELPPAGGAYTGRMASDDGSLVADEGPFRGYPVKFDRASDSFVYVGPADTTHFADHHVQYASVDLEPPA